MAANTTLGASLNLTELDFHGLKNSLRNYLRKQDQFKDYDYEGSAISILLEEMSLNSYLNAFFSNMIHSEGFIDSAQLRNSLYSHSKTLNYLPRSSRSAKAKVRITFTATGETQPYVISKGSQLSTLIKSKAYTFSIPETLTVASADTNFSIETEIYEGIYNKDSYIFLNKENQRFKITNKNVDTQSVTVTVFEDGDQVGEIYKVTNTLLDLTEASKVFFIQTSETGHYEIYFGDNVLGRQPKLNSTIIIDYRLSAGTKGNGARVFAVDFDPTSQNEITSTPVVEVIESSRNGADPETNESIRYYAPRAFQVQERAVTPSDYEISLKTEFPEINAVTVYGGEEVDPPRFGKVFVAIDIAEVEGLPESKKDEYYNFIKRRSPLSIDPIIIEPENMYASITSLVRYNLNITTDSISRIKTLVLAAITDYNDIYLNDFETTLRLSQLSRYIDDSDVSIVSNVTEATVYKKINPTLGVSQNITIDFGLALTDNLPEQTITYKASDLKTIYSSLFRYNGENCVIEDDGSGNIRIVKFMESKRVKMFNIGTVDYEKGVVTLVGFKPDSYDGASLKIYAVPKDKDIHSTKNVILSVEPAEIVVNVEALRL